jgi:hypothetical protein
MASENIGSLYPTKMPGYDDAADIQAALRLYHYGSESYDPSNTNESQIPPNSVAGHLKALDTRVDAVEGAGIGSDYRSSEPTNVPDGFIWVDSDSSPTSFAGKQWVLHDSGNLAEATEIEITELDGEEHKIILKDYEISEDFDLSVSVNNQVIVQPSGSAYEDPSPASNVISIELANTSASIKPTSLGLFKSTDQVSSFTYSILSVSGSNPEFTSGTYEVWSYR